MLKQPFSRVKKTLSIVLAVFFVATLTVGEASSACNTHVHNHMLRHHHKGNGIVALSVKAVVPLAPSSPVTADVVIHY